MDKQIIINGIDVSICEYRDWRNSCHCDNSKENEGEKRVTGRGGCKYNPNCYFKQLKRKEQQCEELKQKLEKEKALKETYLTCYKAKHEDIDEELFKLLQALIDIKGIVKENFYYLECDYRWILEQILQKIREVI